MAFISGTNGDDVLSGTPQTDFVNLLAGNDFFFSGAGNDTVLGGTGNDAIRGDAGNDDLLGEAGNDFLVGGSGHTVGRTRSERQHLDELRAWTREHFPGATETHAWSAQDYSPYDGVPLVGAALLGGGNVHYATG